MKLTRHNLRKYFHDLMDTKIFLKNKFNLHLTFLSSNHLILSMMLLDTKCLLSPSTTSRIIPCFACYITIFMDCQQFHRCECFVLKKTIDCCCILPVKRRKKYKKLEKWMYRCRLTKINSLFFLGLLLDAPFCLKHFAFCCCRTDFTFLKELSKEE